MKWTIKKPILSIVILIVLTGIFSFGQLDQTVIAQVPGKDVLYTTDADFDLGTLVNVNHDAPYNDQLQLDSQIVPFPFINVAASGRGTVVRANTETGEIVGEYRTGPEGRGLNPSRTTVDLFGNVWTANRGEADLIDGVPHGSAVKIGLIFGGTRVDASGTPDPAGGYLAPPFGYNTCADRDGDGLIRTSSGLGDILDWPDITDGIGGSDGLVEDAVDECILIYQRLYDAENARHVSVDADNNVWVGGYPFDFRMFYKLGGATGAVLDSFDARDYGCGGYGGLVDGNGVIWSVGGPLLRYDPATDTGFCIESYGYGLGIDTNGYIWMSLWQGGIVKIAPDGSIVPGFPKPTYQAVTTTTASSSAAEGSLLAGFPAAESAPTAVLMTPGDQKPYQQEMAGTSMSLASTTVSFQVAPNDEWVGSQDPWTPGSTISLTIEDGSSELYTDSMTADGGGNFNFYLWDIFDLQSGHIVTVSDGTNTKTHTVTNLHVDGMDITADTVFGRADPGTSVEVWVHGDGGLSVTADPSGNWTADFSGMTDLTYLSDGGSAQYDGDGDSTGVWWAPPRFQTAPDDDWVSSSGNWTPGATISLTIGDGSSVLYSDFQTADAQGRFFFNLWDVFDLQRGHVVTVSDGTATKTHTVIGLFVDGVDVTADTVFGRANSGFDVHVWVHGDGGTDATPDGSGNWVADFSGMADLTYFSDGGSQQDDDDGDSTAVWWASPRFQVAPEDDWVQSYTRWTPGATISLTIADGSGELYSNSQTADAHGNFNFELWDVFDLQRGHIVTISDGTTTKTHTVFNLFVDGVDVDADTVFGRADAGTDVNVWVHGDGWTTATADGSGNWTADFSGMTDLTYGSDGGSEQIDDDGDVTGVWWSSPSFQVAPEEDWAGSMHPWTAGATISLTIEDGSGVVYTDSTTADSHGHFFIGFWDTFDLQRGHVVSISDGTITKIHTVTNLFVDGVDSTADAVFGRADAGADVDVWVHGDGWTTATAGGSGNWSADFSGMTDLTFLSDGGSSQYDDDGDATSVWWATPRFQVSLDGNWVRSSIKWPGNTPLTVTVYDGPVKEFEYTVTTSPHGDFHLDIWGVDIVPGLEVQVTGGGISKDHIVIDVNVDNVDDAADQISGTAAPGALVQVWVNLFDEGSGRWVTADVSGNWMADFSVENQGQPAYDITGVTMIEVDEFDDDGDSTQLQIGPPTQANRGVAVTPADNHVWVANSGVQTVTRLDNDGEVLKVIETGEQPTGVAVDAAGKVWATNMGSHNAVRIDPIAGTDGLGAIDLTVDLGPDAWPYNYSDMTGIVAVGSTSPQGFWTVVQDSLTDGFEWGRITWNTEPEGSEPSGTEIIVEARAADTEAGLGGQSFQSVLNGELFSMVGRFIEVRATLKSSVAGVSPVLSDIRIQPHTIFVDIDIKPGSYPNAINCENSKETISVAVLTTEDFDAMTIDHTTVTFEGASHYVVNKKTGEPRRFEEDVDLDGDMDLVFHFRLADTDLTCESTEGMLIGLTYDGIQIEGVDSVWVLTNQKPITVLFPYRGWYPRSEVVDNADLLADMLSEHLGQEVYAVVPEGDWTDGQSEAISGMQSGTVDVAFLSWPAFLVAYETAGATPGLNFVRYGSHFYRSQILTYAGSGVEEIADLAGRDLCWVSPDSISGYVIPSWMLMAAGVDPDANAWFTNSHTQVVWELYDQNCDGGAAYVDVRASGGFPPDVMDVVIPIAVSPEIPNDGFAFSEELSDMIRTQLIAALLEIESTPEGADLLEKLIGDNQGLVETDFGLYQDLYDLIYAAGLTPEDIWAP